MAALVMGESRIREASQLASETWVLLKSVGDSILTVGLSTVLLRAKVASGGWLDMLQWSQRVIDLAGGDPFKGDFIFGSPLAAAIAGARSGSLLPGHAGWRDDLHDAVAMARSADAMSYAGVVAYSYLPGIPFGVRSTDDRAEREIEDALGIAGRSGDNVALALARMALGVALVHRPTDAERNRGQQLLAEVSDGSCARVTSCGMCRSYTCTWRVSSFGVAIAITPTADACRRRPPVRRGTAADVGNSSDGSSGRDTAGSRGRR